MGSGVRTGDITKRLRERETRIPIDKKNPYLCLSQRWYGMVSIYATRWLDFDCRASHKG